MIIWLASYPKSGNTWMRMFLKSYFMKSNEKFSLEGSILDSFKPQGFPDQGLLDKLKIDWDTGTENLDACAKVLKEIIRFKAR